MANKSYIYHGPPSGFSLRLGKRKELEVLLHNGQEPMSDGKPVQLPDDNKFVRRLIAREHLTEAPKPAKPAKNPIVPARTTAAKKADK